MTIIFALFLLTLLVIVALAIVRTKNLFVAVMLTSIFSLLMAANFFILDAADVALTEAAVGADKDQNGCIGSAGYRWCAKTKQCERPWELASREDFSKDESAFDTFCGN